MPLTNFGNPPAYMGFVGFVRLMPTDPIPGWRQPDNFLIRATSADIRLSQEITRPDVVDSRYDKTVYQLGPKLIEGTIAFPAIYDQVGDTNVFEALYRYAVTRHPSDGLLTPFDMDVKYAASRGAEQQAEFTYKGCIANTWEFSVTQGDVVNCSTSVIGITRIPTQLKSPGRNDDYTDCAGQDFDTNSSLGTTRIVTWADARVRVNPGRGTTLPIDGRFIREFTVSINNDAERFYTLNQQLFAQAIAPRKREITGSLVLMGRNPALSQIAETNEEFCNESSSLDFGYVSKTNSTCPGADFSVRMPNVIFQIEELALTNDLFETTVNWSSLPAAGTGVCDPLLADIGTISW